MCKYSERHSTSIYLFAKSSWIILRLCWFHHTMKKEKNEDIILGSRGNVKVNFFLCSDCFTLALHLLYIVISFNLYLLYYYCTQEAVNSCDFFMASVNLNYSELNRIVWRFLHLIVLNACNFWYLVTWGRFELLIFPLLNLAITFWN